MKLSSLRLVVAVVSGAVFAACAAGGGSDGNGGPRKPTTGDDAAAPVVTGDGGIQTILGGPDGSVAQGAFTVLPAAPVLTVVSGQSAPTQQFKAIVGGQPTAVAWSIDQGAVGTIDAGGTFTPSATVGGVAKITASVNGQTASTTITVKLQTTDMGDPGWTGTPGDAGAGGYGGVGGNGPGAPPSAGQTGTLKGTPTADASVSILYPYDGTVWPQGLLAPLLQWNPGAYAFDSVYVHIQENDYEYKGYFASNAGAGAFVNVPIPAGAWNAMAFSNGGEPVTISLVFGQGTKAYGPYVQTWKVAQATLKGTIYYNSYGTALVQNSNTPDSYGAQYGAGTLAIAPGTTAPTLVAGVNSPAAAGDGTGCRVCHTVAADGQSLVTEGSNTSATDYSSAVSVNLASDPTGGAGAPLATPNLAFPALYKNGSLLLSSAGGMVYPGSATAATSQLYALPAGTPVAGATGLPSNLQAALPSFSPDGAHVSFDFWAGSLVATTGSTLTGDQASLAVLDFDGASAFSNPRVLYTPPAGKSVTYSSFFPNAAGVVFEVELTNPTNCWGYTWSNNAAIGNTAELWWVNVASGQAHRLDALDGYGATGAVYLPSPATNPQHTPAQDATLNFEATVNPIASGGYAWVVFTSRRIYGNVAQLPPWTSDPRQYPWKDQITDKKLWVAAVNLNAAPGTNPSHPAFYLPAQEIHAGNSRGYWAVEPCRANGQSCATGDQCCGGFCQPAGDAGLECTAQVPTCSGQYEKCTTTSDCCGASAGIQCINDVCTQLVP